MGAYFTHPGFSRYASGVSPYGAPAQSPVPMTSLYAGQVYPATTFGYPAPPPASATPGATGLTTYAANAAAYAGRPYIHYPFSYQTGYPPIAVANHPPTAAGTKATPGANATAAQPFYPGFT